MENGRALSEHLFKSTVIRIKPVLEVLASACLIDCKSDKKIDYEKTKKLLDSVEGYGELKFNLNGGFSTRASLETVREILDDHFSPEHSPIIPEEVYYDGEHRIYRIKDFERNDIKLEAYDSASNARKKISSIDITYVLNGITLWNANGKRNGAAVNNR